MLDTNTYKFQRQAKLTIIKLLRKGKTHNKKKFKKMGTGSRRVQKFDCVGICQIGQYTYRCWSYHYVSLHMYKCQLYYFFVNNTHFTTFKGRRCIRAFLAKGNQRSEKGSGRGGEQALAQGLQHWPQRSLSLWQVSSMDTCRGCIHYHPSGLVFQQPSLLKNDISASSSILHFYHNERNYYISQMILCCIQITKFSNHNLLSPGPAPTIFFPTSCPYITNITPLVQ